MERELHTFTHTSDAEYNRHTYLLVMNDNSTQHATTYDDLLVLNSQLKGQVNRIIILDATQPTQPRTKPNGF